MRKCLVLVCLLILPAANVASVERRIFAHFMLGNTYDYPSKWPSTREGFKWDIERAREAKLDGFSLNLGLEDWQLERMDAMFAAACDFDDFKVFVNLDMAVNRHKDINWLINAVKRNVDSPAQAKIDGKPIVGTFSGHDLTYGVANANEGWRRFKDRLWTEGVDIFFMPFWPLDASRIVNENPVADGFQVWNSWPYFKDERVSFGEDQIYIRNAHARGRVVMSGVSPGFFTHFSNKNFVFRSEDTWHSRWRDLIDSDVDLVQVVTWNDFGESHAIGPVNQAAAYPAYDGSNSRDWNDGMSHEAFYQMLPFYVEWFKTKKQPSITNNSVYFYHRIHSKWVPAVKNDTLGKPANWESAKDVFVIHSHLTKQFDYQLLVDNRIIGQGSFQPGVNHYNVPFPFFTGDVVLVIRDEPCEVARTQPTFIQPWENIEKWNFNFISRAVHF